MRCYVNDRQVQPDGLTYNQFSFGSPFASKRLEYRLLLAREEFINALGPAYDTCLVELRYDDSVTGDFEPPYPGAVDYPSLREFLEIEGPHFKEFFDTFLRFAFLSHFLQEDREHSESLHVISSIDRLSVDRSLVEISGVCFELPAIQNT